MPRKINDRWKLDFRPLGRNGPRIQKAFDTKAEALRYEAWIKTQYIQGDWNPENPDTRRLSELCQLWFDMHGKHLKDGERRLAKLLSTCEALRDPVAKQLSPPAYLRYRSQSKNAAKTLNNELGYINAVYNELERTDQITYPNPIGKIRPIKLIENELTYLEDYEIDELLEEIVQGAHNEHVLLITKICLSTGCRWGEAESLHTRQVKNGRITFTDTKSKKNRAVPISPELEREIHAHGKGNLFTSSIGAFRRALKRTTIILPKGQASHVLRHTFASHFMINGGNILTLQKILGHSSITMTMRYAHLAPDHLKEAITLNPLAKPTPE